ncbi:MAG: hypothetical protein ACHQUA_02760 [Microgenomates group bacterium]
MAEKEVKIDQTKEIGWIAPDGQVIKPDENGKWPAVQVTSDGKTIVAGGDIGKGSADVV